MTRLSNRVLTTILGNGVRVWDGWRFTVDFVSIDSQSTSLASRSVYSRIAVDLPHRHIGSVGPGTDTLRERTDRDSGESRPAAVPVVAAYCFLIISINSSVVFEKTRFSCLTI